MFRLFLLTAILAYVFSVVLTAECDDHEEYSNCTNSGCYPRNCSQLGYPVPCNDPNPEDCIEGYICESGYLRADNGTCIPVNQCPSCNGDPNAESGCGTFCETCETLKTGPVACRRLCMVNGCECRPGYIYDQNRMMCVLPEKCSPTCKANEVYSDCVNGGCDARNCSQLGKPVPCVKMRPEACVRGCVCADGYLRTDNGTCIPKKECPSCGDDPNAESGCGTFCETCANYNTGPVPCPKICKLNGCQCKNGYIYDQNRHMCVLPQDCTPTCKANEVYSDCVNGGCDARNCSQLGKPVPCVKMRPEACVKGCVCGDGYLRADNGTCIPVKECPSCGDDPNAEPGCGTFCEKCSNYKKGPVICPRFCEKNGCQCKKGYIYDQNIKKCVLPKECTPTCKANEVYSDCVNGGCDARNCSQLGKPVPCVKMRPEACVKGCVCGDGYLRADNGTCIPVKECPPTCKENEVYSDCVNGGCEPRNCTQLGNPVPCVRLRPEACIKGCVCKQDYLRAKNGTCIPVKQCPTCGGDPNAESGCGVFCDRCSGPIPCPKICKVNGCQCKKGYIYDQNTNMCVLPKHCTPTCKSHEVYSDCVNGGCQARNCTQLGKPVPCVLVAKGACIKGCVCESGYLRTDNGTCIPEDQCPKCKSGEVYSKCANGICRPQDCSRYGQPAPACAPLRPDMCKPGCVCANKHLRNKDGVCIPQEKCPEAKCQRGEVYSQCSNAPGLIQHCSQYYQAKASCSRTKKPKKCKAACICQDGYLRNKKGVCVPRDECPEAKTTTTTVSPDCDSDED